MSTFSSDRIANIIVPDLQKRFRRGYIDYFNREDKTYRPVEEVQIRSIVPLEQFEELMKLLDDIVLFSAATPELATKFQGLWNRLDLPDKDDKDRIECTRMGLISLESYIKVFIYLLCGNGDLLRQIEAEKHGLGYILNELGVPSPDGKRGLFNSRYKGLFDTLRRYRNGITHSPSDTDTEESDILMPRGNLNDAYDGLFLLTLTGLLLLLHHHAGYYRRYLDEHRPELPPEKAAAASPADDFDLEQFKDRYLEELLGEQNRELKQKVGFIGRIDNQQTLNLLPLKLQRRQDAGEGLSDPDYGGRPHESGDFTDGEQGGMAMDDLIDAGDRISLILGNPGAGKTTVLIRLIRQYADLWHNGDRSILPLRINLNAVTEGQTMDDALRTAFNAGFGITTTEDRKRMVFAHAEQLLAEGRIALFIDGLNELKVSRPELFIASLGSFIAKYDKCRFHITGRIHEFAACREAFRRIEGCGVYHLCEISLDQILLYLRQLGLPEERIDEFRLQIIRAGIEELLGTPLNFMMIAALLLGSTEYKIPAVGNRGELLEMFMRSSLSVRSREKLVDEAVNFNAFDLLQQMAWRIAAEGQRVLREDFVIEIARDPRYKGADRVEKLVDSLIGLHIVEQSVDHKGSWLTFFVDTYLEYFFARRLALDFCERHAPLPGQLDVTNERNFEILKLTLELICSGWVRKEGCIADGRDFVKALYDLGRNPAQPAATTTADGVLQTEGLPSKPAVNGNLALVARMASGLKPYTDKTNPNARLLIESWLLNTMVVYRIGHPIPDTEGDYDYIRQLAEYAVVLSSERIFRELFSDYWLTTLLLTVADDFGMQLPENSVKASALHRALIDNCTDVRLFYRFLHSRYLDLVLFRPRSALRIRKFLSLLFGNLKKYTQKLLYGYIAEWREADAQRQGGDHYLAQDANTLLLCIDDVDYLISRYDLPAAERSRTKIGWPLLRKLVRNYDDERLAAFIFTERFFALLQNREQMALYLFRYYIFRNHFPRCLMQFLFEGTGRKGISPGNLSELLDAFPLEKIPVGEARKRYDNEIYDYLTQETHSEESDDGLIYRIFDVNAERIRLAIKDANTPFEGLTACIRTDDTRMFCRVEADGYVDARGETFSLSSRDGSLLPVSGKIVAPDGTELAYAASASNKEISVTCYDKAEIAWLHALAEAGTGVRIGSAECSLRFAVSAPLICHRVLTLRRDAACGLPRFTGEITFFRGDDRSAPVVIDRRTRPENRYRSHRLFQPITQAPLKAPETPYILFGYAGRKALVITDKLMNADRYPGASVRLWTRNQSAACRFVAGCKMQQGFAELTLRSSVKWDLKPSGTLRHTLPDGSTEHIPYIFCLSNRTTFVLRIFHEDFVARIRDRSVCDRYIAGKDDFRVGKLSLRLESAEYYEPNSKLSLLELELADGQSAVPAKGSLAITLKHEMQPAQLSFTGESRGPSTMLVNVCCAGIDLQGREARFLVPDSGMPLAKGLYLRAPGSTAHLCIRQTPQPVQWCVELELRAELRFPESGEIGFEEFPGVMFGFRNLTVGERTGTLLVWCAGEAAIDCDSFIRTVSQATRITLSSGGRQTQMELYQAGDAVRRTGYGRLAVVDFPGGAEADAAAYYAANRLLVEILMPVVNTIDIPKVDKALYKIHSLGYNKAGSNRIRIVRPLTGIDKLWLSLDDTKIMCRPRNPVTEILDGVEYLCLGVETETGVVPRILNTGSVHFFRRGESGTEPEQVGFGVIFPLIAYGRPERYHADICDVVSSEMAHTVTIINEQIIEFFVAKSRSYLLLDNEKFFEQICRMKTCGQVFDVCRIVSQDNAQGLTVYSPLHKTTACTCDTEAGFSAPGYEADSYVLFEKNHRIRLLRDIPRQPCMGCKTGVVVYYNERRDAFISVENETEDYYYPMRDDETLQPGDRVTFFATENLLYKRRRNAGKTMMADNVQYAGAAPSYRGRVVDKVTRQDAASGTTLFELTVAADDKRLPRSQVTITLYDTSNQRWSVISAWEKGTPCSFFIAKGKWYLHLTPDPAQTPSTENAHGE